MEPTWLLLCACGALLGRAGMLIFLAGLSRSKNATSAAVRSMLDLALMNVTLLIIGLAIAAQVHNPLFGINARLVLCRVPGADLTLLLQPMMLMLLCGGAIALAGVERSRFWPLVIVSIVAALLVLPVIYNWILFGWMGRFDAHGPDRVAGLLCVASGAAGAVVAKQVGARNGKYHRDGSTSMIPGHSVPLVMLGTMLQVVGWVSMALWYAPEARTVLGAIACMSMSLITAAAYSQLHFGKPDPLLLAGALLGGAVVCATSVGLPVWGFLLCGVVMGFAVPWLTVHMDMNLKFDDPTGLSAVLLCAGATGLLSGPLADAGPIVNRLKNSGLVVGEALVAAVVGAVVIGLTLKIVSRFVPLKSKEADEYDGLDLAEHEINSYPDFQQTTIKSYHMREA